MTGTLTGRALVLGALVKATAYLLGVVRGPSALGDAIDLVGDVAFAVGAALLAYRLYGYARRHLLWRVRRKLILSYVFIGVVPVLLVVVFFTLGGLLFFFNISAFVLRSHVEALVEAAEFLAQGTAAVLEQAAGPTRSGALSGRQAVAVSRYPLISYAVVPAAACGGDTAVTATVAAGPWAHVVAPESIPAWVPCSGFASLITYDMGGLARVAARAVVWPRGLGGALVVDIPFGDELAARFRNEMGLTIERFSTLGPTSQAEPAGPITWVAFLDFTDWRTGMESTLAVGFRMGPAALYRYLSGPSFAGLDNVNFGQALLLLLAVVGGLFLVIQAVASVMGFRLARSITGSVHELAAGTERVQRGDFSHKIAIHSRDQLGELAESFNSMTASIEGLLHEKAEKDRLEQELQIARSIQMSLLPQGPLQMPGLALAGHCEPAREVGGDYYDFLPLEGNRLGILIADVAGKGTSAALYMAELKGLMLSLSQLHTSPRQLLVDANRIISKHLDASSFITMTYAVVDLGARTLACARAGHCPLIYVPGPTAASRTPQTLTPDGMVLGLQFDTGDAFSRLLEEITLPLARGDLFLLYTDGISEAMNGQSDWFGDARLADLAGAHADLTPEELRERILRDVHAFTGDAPQHDDMTMVILKIEDL